MADITLTALPKEIRSATLVLYIRLWQRNHQSKAKYYTVSQPDPDLLQGLKHGDSRLRRAAIT